MNPKWNPPAHDSKPFENLIIDNCDILESIEQRTACERCCKSRKYFCYTCYIPVTSIKNLIPKIKVIHLFIFFFFFFHLKNLLRQLT